MKEHRCILLVDDKDQGDVTESIRIQMRSEFDLEFILIRTAAPEYKKDDSEEIDLDKLRDGIKTSIQYKTINVALTDFDLDSDVVNGLSIVHMVHEFRQKINFLIYSGNWNEVIRTVVGGDYQEAPIDHLVDGINAFIHDRIVDCIGRTDYKDDLIKYLRKNENDSIEHRLSSLLRAHGDMIFESCYPEFKGMTFNEIADLVDNHADARSDEWIDAVLSQTIAYLVKVNQ
ncbi:MAG: hypothetical protein SPH36_01590 [Candidatus Cryptobacteroides sp.]|nr:hypothetical protein [Candidatus Cryptobacteroides sp.]